MHFYLKTYTFICVCTFARAWRAFTRVYLHFCWYYNKKSSTCTQGKRKYIFQNLLAIYYIKYFYYFHYYSNYKAKNCFPLQTHTHCSPPYTLPIPIQSHHGHSRTHTHIRIYFTLANFINTTWHRSRSISRGTRRLSISHPPISHSTRALLWESVFAGVYIHITERERE